MAYGARLESVLGASPRGFESPILRSDTENPVNSRNWRGFFLPKTLSWLRKDCSPLVPVTSPAKKSSGNRIDTEDYPVRNESSKQQAKCQLLTKPKKI